MCTRLQTQKGQSLVELALVLPVLLLLVVGTLDLGRAYSAYVGIVGAAEQGAVVASDLGRDGSAVYAAVRGEPQGTTNTLSIPDANIAISCPASAPLNLSIPESCRMRGQPVTVTVFHDFRVVTPFVQRVVGTDTVRLNASASMAVR